MTQVQFHYSKQGIFVERCGALVSDLTETRDYAELVIRSLIATPCPEDWRGWVLHVSDDLGDVILVVPFASLLGKSH
jgi:hypothetical protein